MNGTPPPLPAGVRGVRGSLKRARRSVRRLMDAVSWARRHPGGFTAHRGYFLQSLGLGPFLGRIPGVQGRLSYLSPVFLEEHGRPLVDPPFVEASAAHHMLDDDVVVGVEFEGDARAYPWWLLDDHHVANDVVGGRPVLIVFCEMCSTAVGFDPVVDGRRLTFTHGPHHNGTNTAQDLETGSVWSAYLAKALTGPLAGRSLPILPLQQVTWAVWREGHPSTRVLSPSVGERFGHGGGHGIGDGHMSPGFRRSVVHWDDRLPHNELVLGVLGREARAYPLELVRAGGGVVNDSLDERPIVVLMDPGPGSYGALAFSREVDGRTLTFSPGPSGPMDEETGSRWTFEGRAAEGPLAGTRLRFVPSHVAEWFVWVTHYPDMRLWEGARA